MTDVAVELFGSQTLPRLLSLLIENPGRPMTVGELARELGGANRDSLYRALRRAEAAGVVTREIRGRTSAYMAATDSPVYPELKSLLTKLLGLGPQIRQALTGREGVEQAFLYGSYASGEDTAASDVDLFVIGSLSGLELTTALRPVLGNLGREINVTSYTRSEVETRLAAGNPFIADVWAKPKIMLIGEEADLPQARIGAQVGPAFAQETAARGMRFSTSYVLAGVSEALEPELDEGHLDRIEEWAMSIRPDAKVLTANPDVGAWQVPEVGASSPEWQAWLYPGPVLSVRKGIQPVVQRDERLISLLDLVAWWRELSQQVPRVLHELGHRRARLGLTVEPWGTEARLSGVDFTGLPPAKGIGPHQVPPWQYITPDFDLPIVPAAHLEEAVRRLLRHWSYRAIDSTLKALDLG